MSWVPKAMKAVAAERILDADLAAPVTFGSTSTLTAHANTDRTHCFIISADELRSTSAALHDAFEAALDSPQTWSSLRTPNTAASSSLLKHPFIFHSFAAKANPLEKVLTFAGKECGLACETASMGEFAMAQRAGFPLHNIIFDSPVKTSAELKYVLEQGQGATEGGSFLNVDNFEELDRVVKIYSATVPNDSATGHNTTVGLRINPQLGQGAIGQLSTALATSKFGIGLHDAKKEILAAFEKHPSFLNMLHVHTGSQGIGLKMMVSGVKAIVDLAEEINASGNGRVSVIDIGGGLPVNFASDEYTPTFATYVQALKENIPVLFSGKYSIITEFGRSIVAKAGILASRVEYVKFNGGRRIIQQHIGADLAIRTVWQPENWKLRVDVYNLYEEAKDGSSSRTPTGVLRELDGKTDIQTDVAGPCCLGGDLMCTDRALPAKVRSLDDCVVLKDVGGYYHSSFSHYNLRSAPPCYLFHEVDSRLEQIHRGDSIDSAHNPYLKSA